MGTVVVRDFMPRRDVRKAAKSSPGVCGRLAAGTASRTQYFEGSDVALLARARDCHNSFAAFRAQRDRCKRFAYGDQWSDRDKAGGSDMAEGDIIIGQGHTPLQNNLIRRLVRNVLGVYRDRWKTPKCRCQGREDLTRMINSMLAQNLEENRAMELYARTMEEFLISGLAVHKKWYGIRDRSTICRTDPVNAVNFFFETAGTDFRGCDISLVGERHVVHFGDLAALMARTPKEQTRLREIYAAGSGPLADTMECEVWEVWQRRRENRRYAYNPGLGVLRPVDQDAKSRKAQEAESSVETRFCRLEEEWQYSFISPGGDLLRRGVTPYQHGSHPYVVKAYPYIDGEIHSFVSDIIDQQKLTNRLISMYDWILRSSAKGVLLFPEGSLPDGVDINDIADEWSRFNGVIVYRPRPGVALPQQVSSRSTDIGITEFLEIQMKMMEDITGVSGALQGKLDNVSMSGTLYERQTRNSLTALADMMLTYEDFVAEGVTKDIRNLMQYGNGVAAGPRLQLRI